MCPRENETSEIFRTFLNKHRLLPQIPLSTLQERASIINAKICKTMFVINRVSYFIENGTITTQETFLTADVVVSGKGTGNFTFRDCRVFRSIDCQPLLVNQSWVSWNSLERNIRGTESIAIYRLPRDSFR
jgi:hypothetical protein